MEGFPEEGGFLRARPRGLQLRLWGGEGTAPPVTLLGGPSWILTLAHAL